MATEFVVYVDESGCDGIKTFRQAGQSGGTSHWLVLAAMIVPASLEPDAPRWRDDIMALFPGKQRRDLHFINLKHEQKVAACQHLANLPVRVIAVMSNKTNIPNHDRPDLFQPKNSLYWFLCRYLLERVSKDCKRMLDRSRRQGTVELIFARRGGMDYTEFQDYLRRLRRNERHFGAPSYIDWDVVDIDGVKAIDHVNRAGLQLVDGFAHALAAAVEPNVFGNFEPRYAEIVRPRFVAGQGGRILGIGIKPVPNIAQMQLHPDQQRFFDMFG